MKVSTFHGVAPTVSDNRTIDKVLSAIKSGTYRKQVERVRAEADKAKRDELKRQLMGFTASGTFNGTRKADALLEHSGFIVLDFDDVADVESAKKSLSADEYVYAVFISPSGNGLKCVVKIDGAKHRESFKQLAAHFKERHGLTADESGKDVSRLCFVSYDPDIYLNDNSKTFIAIDEPKPLVPLAPVARLQSPPTIDKTQMQRDARFALECAVKPLQDALNGQRHAANTKQSTLIGGLIAGGFVDESVATGVLETVILGKFEPERHAEELRTMRECVEHGKRQPITYERWLQNRADFFAGTGQQLHKSNEQTADDFKEQSSFGKAVKLIQEHFDVHYNLVRARPEIRLRKPFPNAPDCFTEKFTPVCNREKQSLRVWLKTQGVNASKDSVEMILESHLCPRWNPFFDFYDNLPVWDGIDRITQYADTVRTTSQPYWRKYFRKWLCSMVAAWRYDNVVNHSVIVLVGRRQGTGKTRWIGEILPPELADYYALLAHIDTADRYMKILLSEKGLVNLDDFEELTRKEHGKLKSFITQPQIASRRNYGENEDFIHRASIAGSTNQRYFLSDMSGSRRWIVVELVESDENPISEKDARAIDKSQLYAQCRHIIESGETYYVASTDFEEIETHNAQFKLASPEEELVALNFRKPDETESAEMLTASEIKSILETRYKTTLSDVGVGKVLSRLGFEQETKWKPEKGFTVRAYRVKRLGGVFETDFPKF